MASKLETRIKKLETTILSIAPERVTKLIQGYRKVLSASPAMSLLGGKFDTNNLDRLASVLSDMTDSTDDELELEDRLRFIQEFEDEINRLLKILGKKSDLMIFGIEKVEARAEKTSALAMKLMRELDKLRANKTVSLDLLASKERDAYAALLEAVRNRRDVLLIHAKNDMLASYGSRVKIDMKEVDLIKKAKSSSELLLLLVRLGIPETHFISLMQIEEGKILSVKLELDLIQSLIDDPEERRIYYGFLRTGRIPKQKNYILGKRLRIQYKGLNRLLSKQEFDKNSNDAYYSSIRERYSHLIDIDQPLRDSVSLRLGGYAVLLQRMYENTTRVIGVYRTMKYLGMDIEDENGVVKKGLLTKRISEDGKKAEMYKRRLIEVYHFLEEIPPKLRSVEDASVSPLQAPLLRQEFQPYIDKVSKNLDLVVKAVNLLGYRMQTFNKFVDSSQFDIATELGMRCLSDYLASVKSPRVKIGLVKDRLEYLLKLDGLAAHLPPVMKKIRKKILKDLFAHVEKLLNKIDGYISGASSAYQKLKKQKERNGKWWRRVIDFFTDATSAISNKKSPLNKPIKLMIGDVDSREYLA